MLAAPSGSDARPSVVGRAPRPHGASSTSDAVALPWGLPRCQLRLLGARDAGFTMGLPWCRRRPLRARREQMARLQMMSDD
eukprot:8808056-Pyramimonas_sp.AAC.1